MLSSKPQIDDDIVYTLRQTLEKLAGMSELTAVRSPVSKIELAEMANVVGDCRLELIRRREGQLSDEQLRCLHNLDFRLSQSITGKLSPVPLPSMAAREIASFGWNTPGP